MALSHLAQAAKWARILAIIGFVGLGLGLVAMGFSMFSLATIDSIGQTGAETTDATPGPGAALRGMLGGTMFIVYLIVALVYFFPLLWLLQFSAKARLALATQQEGLLAESMHRLKRFFQYIGILMIILIALYSMVFLMTMLFAATTLP